MSTKTINIDEKLYEYLLNNSLREPELLKKTERRNGIDAQWIDADFAGTGPIYGTFGTLNRNQKDSGNWSLYRLQFTRDGVGPS